MLAHGGSAALLLCSSSAWAPLGPRPRRPRGPHHPVCFFCFRLCGYALCEKMRPWLTLCTKPPTSSSSMPAAARASRKQESSLQQLKLLTPLRKHSSGLAAKCWRDLRVIIKLSSLASLRKPCASIHFRAICLGLGQGLLSGANKHTDTGQTVGSNQESQTQGASRILQSRQLGAQMLASQKSREASSIANSES